MKFNKYGKVVWLDVTKAINLDLLFREENFFHSSYVMAGCENNMQCINYKFHPAIVNWI